MSDKSEKATGKDELEKQSGDAKDKSTPLPTELGGRKGPEPTRYGDWEKNGIISDF